MTTCPKDFLSLKSAINTDLLLDCWLDSMLTLILSHPVWNLMKFIALASFVFLASIFPWGVFPNRLQYISWVIFWLDIPWKLFESWWQLYVVRCLFVCLVSKFTWLVPIGRNRCKEPFWRVCWRPFWSLHNLKIIFRYWCCY